MAHNLAENTADKKPWLYYLERVADVSSRCVLGLTVFLVSLWFATSNTTVTSPWWVLLHWFSFFAVLYVGIFAGAQLFVRDAEPGVRAFLAWGYTWGLFLHACLGGSIIIGGLLLYALIAG